MHPYSLLKSVFLIIWGVVAFSSCADVKKHPKGVVEFSPASDPLNSEGWVLNTEISDEFNTPDLDTTKWFVEGQNGDYYIWKGKAPSQFVPHNVRIEEGILKLRTAWEPDYEFYEESYTDGNMGTAKYGEYKGEPMPVTTAAVISKKRFLNGYMEVKSKVGNAAITGAFWGN